MATQTTHFHLIKPTSAERVAVGDINDNSDVIDSVMFANKEKAEQLADDYNAGETYNTGDYVRRENYLYKCNTDNTTGTWNVTKWDRVKVMDEISQGGGGSSTLAGLSDVALSSPSNGQLLGYDSTTQKWKNVNGGGGGSSTLAGLSDVSVSGVADKDIIRYNSTSQKYEKSSDLTDLELSVSQLSSSVLSIAGDVNTLELTVSQMSASTLPYDANTSTKQKIDNVESSIPTSASDLPYSSGVSTKEKIDSIAPQGVTVSINSDYVEASNFSVSAIRFGKMVIISGRFQIKTQKPSGQSYVLMSGLPAPPSGSIVPIFSNTEDNLIIVGGGITSNNAISPKYMNIMCSYISNN